MRRVIEHGMCVGIVLGALGPAAIGQIQLVERTDSGLAPYAWPTGMTGGAAAADYDADGDIDLLVPTGFGHAPRLYQNDGSGRFTDVAASVGLTALDRDRLGLLLDADGDGDLDILLAGDNHFVSAQLARPTTLRLYEQRPDGSFVDVTVAAGLFEDLPLGWTGEYDLATHLGALAAGDLDGDGDADLVGTFWYGRDFRFRNNGDGTFTNVTDLAGVPTSVDESSWQPLIMDVDRDGLLDIVQTIDFGPNRLWMNQGGWSFVDMASAAGCDVSANHMGAAAADYDNDGDLDVYMTNIHDPQQPPITPAWGTQSNPLFENGGWCGGPGFTNVSAAAGVDRGDWGWGCTWADLDLDGWVDLAETNGFAGREFFRTDTSRLWRNLGGSPVTFEDVSASSGFADDSIGSTLLAFDADRDGDLDTLQVHGGSSEAGGRLRLMINETPRVPGASGWLVVKPRRSDIADRFSIGSRVTVEAGGRTMTRLITAGTSMGGQEPFEAHFGLGDAAVIDRIEVAWPDGVRRALEGVAIPGAPLVITPGVVCPGDVDADGDVDVFDFSDMAAAFGSGPCAAPAQGDVNGDGEVDVFDFAELAAGFGCDE
jgi:hypothetical protein